MIIERKIGQKRCFFFEEPGAKTVLIQGVDLHDLSQLEAQIAAIRQRVSSPFALAAFQVDDWDRELSPWAAPPVFGDRAFGDGAAETLSFVTDALIPHLKEVYGDELTLYLGGYSLSGLFALWAGYQTDLFAGVAAVSPSVWFPGWADYMIQHAIRSPKVYLSLGTKEEKTRNKTMASVGDNIRAQHALLTQQETVRACTLEWNPGNHFVDSALRTAKGFAWLMNEP